MALDGAWAEVERRGDLGVRLPRSDELRDLLLAMAAVSKSRISGAESSASASRSTRPSCSRR